MGLAQWKSPCPVYTRPWGQSQHHEINKNQITSHDEKTADTFASMLPCRCVGCIYHCVGNVTIHMSVKGKVKGFLLFPPYTAIFHRLCFVLFGCQYSMKNCTMISCVLKKKKKNAGLKWFEVTSALLIFLVWGPSWNFMCLKVHNGLPTSRWLMLF